MSSDIDFAQPPHLAVRLITLFARADEAEPILGDLLEEFDSVAAKSGIACARRWYWRQTVKTTVHLAGAQFGTAAWSITAAVAGGFLLRWFISRWTTPAIKGAIDAVLYQYGFYEDPDAYLFWLKNSMLAIGLLVNVLIGGLVAIVAKEREMTATVTLALVGALLAIHASLRTVVETGDAGVLWTLPHTFAFSIAIVIVGATVRTFRSARPTPRSGV